MTYIIDYNNDAADVYSGIDRNRKDIVVNKLYDIATNEFRQPWEWDYKEVHTRAADGRLRVGDDLRVFMSVDQDAEVLRVSDVGHRENLY
ncbi:type II toxin-antitoxin system RelE family toxin [Haloarcula laminariae]|uniref:type II toxin-antitoxin system RelE family toxin n=1 Tax=Haloarcula laminariae TaxID=2961577 RepID=UPI0021C76F55|nr:hypothetical protein [Halomicroarcula laminariae]